MKNIKLKFIIVLLLICISIFFYQYIPKKTIYFNESNMELINPARGFYVQINSYEDNRIKELSREGIKIVLIAYDIEDYINTIISEGKLEELDIVLYEARKHNMQIIFRAAYGFDPNYNDPVSVDTIYTHISQIAPIINNYKDVIMCVQAGFIGPWGEWHSSKFFTGDKEEVKIRNNILSSLIESLDEEIIINVRRLRFIRDAIEAGIDKSRLGLHNDAFLANSNDLGTYDDKDYTREEELKWAKTNITHGINGGEMPLISDYTTIDNAIAEMNSLQISYLNCRYNKDILNYWKTVPYKGGTGYEYVKNHLGYRLWLSEVRIPKYLKDNRKFNIELTLNNSGFAPIQKGYEVHLIFKQDGKIKLNNTIEGDISLIKSGMSKKLKVDAHVNDLFESENKEDIQVGIYITNPSKVKNISDMGEIELANEELMYENGVNFFAIYKYDNNKYRILN